MLSSASELENFRSLVAKKVAPYVVRTLDMCRLNMFQSIGAFVK